MDALTGHQRESYLTAHYLYHNQQGLKYWTFAQPISSGYDKRMRKDKCGVPEK